MAICLKLKLKNMWKNKVETKLEVETPNEEVETKLEVETKKSSFPKVYIHKSSDCELMFWKSKFSKWKVIINDLEEETKLKGTLDYQYWFIKEEV